MVTTGNGLCFANVSAFVSAEEKQKREPKNDLLEIVLVVLQGELVVKSSLVTSEPMRTCVIDKTQTICCSQRLGRELIGLLTQVAGGADEVQPLIHRVTHTMLLCLFIDCVKH